MDGIVNVRKLVALGNLLAGRLINPMIKVSKEATLRPGGRPCFGTLAL